VAQVFYAGGTLLEFILLCLLLRGPVRRYPVFFAYISARFLGDLLLAYTYRNMGQTSPAYRNTYWSFEIADAMLLFLVLMTFTYEALRGNPLRPKAGRILAAIGVLTLASPFALFSSRVFSYRWFNSTDQMLNFGGAIMNLVLWGALLANRRRDPQLLPISMGVGVTATSAAIVWGARLWVSARHRWPIDDFAILAYYVSLLLWCWVFRPKRGAPSRPSAPKTP
jgi:hypothetical protein